MDPPILDPLDTDTNFFGGSGSRVSFLGVNMGSFFIIDQISQKPWYFFTVNLSQEAINSYDYWKCETFSEQ